MKAIERIAHKETLYKKVGKKYVPVNDPYAYEGLREGWWLVKVAEGSTTIRSIVYPSKAEIIAAAKDKEDQLVKIIRESSEAKPNEGVPLSEQCRKDWQWLIGKHGKELSVIYYPSFQENAEKIVNALLEPRYGKL
jgi:hypothetical protein